MSDVVVMKGENNNGKARYQCSWHVSDTSTGQSSAPSWMESLEFSWPQNTENAELMVEHSAHKQNQIQPQDFGSTASFSIVLDCLKRADHGQESVATLVVPRSSGYIVRSDIIPLRLIDCALVTNVVSFSKPLQFFDGSPVAIDNLQQLPNIFAASVGSMLLRSIDSASVNAPEPPSTSFDRVKHRLLESLTSSLERELRDRLSFPWLSMTKPKRQNLAIVEGGRTVPDNGGVGESIYTAAAALGIDMVVFENPGHWLQDARYAHWYKAFVSLKLELHPSANFTCDIVNAVRSYKGHLDGIVTFRDQYRPYVAEAALQLGLLTEPPSAYGIFTDKFKTSVSEGHHAYRASSIEQASSIVQEYGLDFPLITKPTNGFLSEGVFRIENLPQLEAGIKGININRHGSEFVIEKYCDGPEVDANVVLCDQKMIFIEAMLRDSLTQSLLRMGFKNGFFHLEARVENSNMEYVMNDGTLDLAERSIPVKEAQSCWLIEANPRPPGIQASDASKHTYGIDYWGLGLLFALHDNHRIKQLSHPFEQGPQYWCDIVCIPVPKGGVYESADVCAELFVRRPELAAHVSGSFCWLKKGDRVPDPGTGENAWVSYFNVFSRESRAHVLEIAETIRRECKFSII